MPRSFLVKTHQGARKPAYVGPRAHAEEALSSTHKDPPPHHHCPEPSPQLQQGAQRSSPPCAPPLRAAVPSPSSPSPSSLSPSAPSAEAATEANVEVKCGGGLPPPLPLLALFPGGVGGGGGGGRGSFECLDCREGCLGFPGLGKRKQLQLEWGGKKCFSCKYCEKEYVSLGALKMHIRTHTLPCVCTLCGKAFSRPWLLQGHIRTHTGEKPFSCLHCSRAFADRSNLRAHLQTHSEVKKYRCASCFKTFSRISLLAKHQEAGCPVS